MSDKVTMDVKAKDYGGSGMSLYARGSFSVDFSKKSVIGKQLDVKDKERFKVTVERVK